MTRLGLIRLGGAIPLACAAAIGVRVAARPVEVPVMPRPPVTQGRVPESPAVTPVRAFQAARHSAGFRLTRSRSSVSGPKAHGAVIVPDLPRPVLSLVGVASAPERTALVNGVPGRTSTMLMSPGDTAGGLRVLKVLADRVTLAGYDTTWTLRLGAAQ